MGPDSTRILFVGDIHLGRRPGRLPRDLAEYGVDPTDLKPVAAWRASVRRAIALDVDAVVLAGDVIESADDRFEAYGHLVDGVRSLERAGIRVLGVAGNHDVEALPRLAEQIPGFRLVGRGGVWELASLSGTDSGTDSGTEKPDEGGPLLLGWSFPSARVREDPLGSLPPDLLQGVREGTPVLGVLHADLDGGSSHYAPVARSALEGVAVDAWLLGHIHKPSLAEPAAGEGAAGRPLGYLGSLVGLDPGEPGARGPWLVSVQGAGRITVQHLPLSPLRWERVDLDLAQLDEEPSYPPHPSTPSRVSDASDARHRSGGGFDDRFFGALRRALAKVRERIAGEADGVKAVGCRVRLVGRCREHRRVGAWIDRDAEARDAAGTAWPQQELDGIHFFIEKIEDAGAPAIDLERLARGSDPAALLARRLVALEADGAESRRLIEAGARRLGGALARGVDPGGEALTIEEVRGALLRSGTRALEELLAQRSAGESGAAPAGGAG